MGKEEDAVGEAGLCRGITGSEALRALLGEGITEGADVGLDVGQAFVRLPESGVGLEAAEPPGFNIFGAGGRHPSSNGTGGVAGKDFLQQATELVGADGL